MEQREDFEPVVLGCDADGNDDEDVVEGGSGARTATVALTRDNFSCKSSTVRA